jgi:hypothetical protein
VNPVTKEIVIGHVTKQGVFADAVYKNTNLSSTVDYNLGVTLKGTKVSVTLNSQTILSRTYNAVATDGGFGLLGWSGMTSFDLFNVKTDTPQAALG